MDDHHHEGGHDDHHDEHGAGEHHEGEQVGRVTSPMQEFTTGQAGTGFVVLVVGLVVVFGIPLLLA